jgi:putative sterol carrier protein
MSHPFPSESWIAAYAAELNSCPSYREAARTWTHGAIALAVAPDPEIGLPRGFAVWLDVEGGACRAARAVTLEDAAAAPFCITASYAQWRAVLERRLDPIAGMVTRKLKLSGNLVTMLRYVRSAQAMVKCAARVPATFRESIAVAS